MNAELSALDKLLEVVKQVGFPIVVACWFMFRTDKKLEALTATINKLRGGHLHFREEDAEL